jgi:hypothetical protein
MARSAQPQARPKFNFSSFGALDMWDFLGRLVFGYRQHGLVRTVGLASCSHTHSGML